MPLVSIIVPVYKAEQWLHRCVDSILAQTMTDFELLLINDGSPDKSGEICDEYAKQDSRIRVFHKENGGVSSARQMGLESAIGEYVIHCDPDDWVEPDMLLELTQYAKETQSDMVICDFCTENINGGELMYHKQDLKSIDTSFNVLNKLVNLKIHGSCCNKLVRRTCLDGISFHPFDLVYAEDQLFNAKVLKQDIRVGYLNKAYYHYVVRKGSITSFEDKNAVLSRIKEIDELQKVLDESEFNSFFELKRIVLYDLFFANKLKEVYGIFSEIYPKIVVNKISYRFKLPKQYFFIMGIKGYPRLAYYLCNLNLCIISTFQWVKIIFNC